MDRSAALAALRTAAVDVLSVEADQVTEDASFADDLDADSLDLVELVMQLEDSLDVKIEEDDLGDVTHRRRRRRPDPGGRAPRVDGAEPMATDHRGRPRVVVTGMGVKTPAGLTVDDLWDTLLAAALGGGADHALRRRPAPASASPARSRGFDPVPYVGPKEVRRTDRTALLGVAAAADALADATAGDRHRRLRRHAGRPAAPAAAWSPAPASAASARWRTRSSATPSAGPTRVSPFLVPMMMANATAALVGIRHGFTGPNLAVATACATGAHAIGEGARLVRDGMADVVVVRRHRGLRQPRCRMAAFARMGALSQEPRPAERVAPLRRRPRRLRHGRGRGVPGARAVRAGAWPAAPPSTARCSATA